LGGGGGSSISSRSSSNDDDDDNNNNNSGFNSVGEILVIAKFNFSVYTLLL